MVERLMIVADLLPPIQPVRPPIPFLDTLFVVFLVITIVSLVVAAVAGVLAMRPRSVLLGLPLGRIVGVSLIVAAACGCFTILLAP